MKLIKNKIILGLIYLSSSLFMFFILFGIENDALTVKTLYNGIEDDYIYVVNPPLRDLVQIEGEIALYKDVYIKINDGDIKVIYMNKEASKIGVPYYENSFIKIDEALAPGFYSNVNHEGFTQLKNISLPNFNNNITNRNYNTDVFFCITDDYDYKDPSLVVCKDNEQNHKLFYIDNNDDFVKLNCANGKQIKKYYKGVYNNTIVLMSLLAYVPYILSIWLLFNFIFLIINSNYKENKINQLFYKRKKDMNMKLFKDIIPYLFVSLFISSLIAEIIYKLPIKVFALYTSISLLVLVFVTILAIRLATKKFYRLGLHMEEIR